MTTNDRNQLANASSPYLRQHADNPVHWQRWDDDTLTHARETDMPILLSIGYSACHWCHVMAHECFENTAIADAMNRAFINIKLDREERPDIDHVYQLAHQAFNGRGGGWPLTAFLDPQDLSPFYIGTYFPPTPRHGLPGFPEVLQRVRSYFDTHRDELRAQAKQLTTWLQQAQANASSDTADLTRINANALQRVASRFDPQWGGTQGAPKFPRASELEWLLDIDDDSAHAMAQRTLAMMAMRGLQDHLGGGFFRYCVDAAWTIPHFEKMLYDNAQLLPVYARTAADVRVDADLRSLASGTVHATVDWLLRDMTSPEGAFYSSLDADSEGEEGKFYLWTRDEMRAALDQPEFAVAEAAFGLDEPPNFEQRAWHLLRAVSLEDVAKKLKQPAAAVETHFASARRKLFDVRECRAHPTRDDKILTAWNALMISGLARCARLLDDARCGDAATHALAALRTQAWIDGKLYANAANAASRIPGFLDDHAFLLDALLEALQLAFDPHDLEWAIALADALLDNFMDAESGGFWFSAAAHATPLARSRNWMDEALPNGNGVAIRSLLRLGHLIGETRYIDGAERALHAAQDALQRYPEACPTLLRAAHEFKNPCTQVVVRCKTATIEDWQIALREAIHAIAPGSGDNAIDAFVIPAGLNALPGLLAARGAKPGSDAAYVCAGLACQPPVSSPDKLNHALRDAIPG
ncbi:MAG TPA: thioredoxin domain-containing protein [Rhodanobacteraceae bacterium]